METKSKAWYLEKFNFFSDLTVDERNFLCRHSLMKLFRKGEAIYFPGDASLFVYFLKEGQVRITRVNDNDDEIIVAILKEGDVFGEASVISQDKRGEMAVAHTDVNICMLSESDMKELMQRNFRLNLSIFATIGLRSKKLEKRLEDLVFQDNKQRIRNVIKELALEYGHQTKTDIVIENFLTHETIAKLASTSRQAVTTELNSLKKQQVLDYNRQRRMVIMQLDKL